MPDPQQASIKLSRLPKANLGDLHIWADFIELLALFNIDRQTTRADALDRMRPASEDLGEGAIDELDNSPVEPPDVAVVDDEWATRADDWFGHLRFRQSLFGDAYPFELADSDHVVRRKEHLTPLQEAYVALLFASNLRYFGAQKDVLTKGFERLSAAILGVCFPKAEIHIFGTSAEEGGRYTGNLLTKVKKLVSDLRTDLIRKDGDFSPHDVGDNGLDVVAWVPTGDELDTLFIVFGQCACTEEWDVKQFSSSASKWNSVMNFGHPPANVLFIPFALRKSDGGWHDRKDFANIVMIDRFRFLYLLKSIQETYQAQACAPVVRALLTNTEPVI